MGRSGGDRIGEEGSWAVGGRQAEKNISFAELDLTHIVDRRFRRLQGFVAASNLRARDLGSSLSDRYHHLWKGLFLAVGLS